MNLTVAEFAAQAETQIRGFMERMNHFPLPDSELRTRAEAAATAVLAEHDQFAAHLMNGGSRTFAEPHQPQHLQPAQVEDPYGKAFMIFLLPIALSQRQVTDMCPHAWEVDRVVLALLGPRWMGCQPCLHDAARRFPTEDDRTCDFCQQPLVYARMITTQAGNITMIGDYCDRCEPTLSEILNIPPTPDP